MFALHADCVDRNAHNVSFVLVQLACLTLTVVLLKLCLSLALVDLSNGHDASWFFDPRANEVCVCVVHTLRFD